MAIDSITVFPLLILCFSYFAIFTPTTCSNNTTDLHALLPFKAAINLDPFGALDSWNDTHDHFCSWKGIQCSHRHRDRVVQISLPSKGLAGSLSPHLGNLSFLRVLNLTSNSFHGQIPQEITHLTRLTHADFGNNALIGSIPRNLSQCSNLVLLNFTENSFSGTIPSELGYLYKLKYLSLYKNTLSGPIPSSFGNLTSLVKLVLSTCDLEGEIPESLSRLKSLTLLNLGVNCFTGGIPSGLFNISTMDVFAVHSNQLRGVIPSDIGLTLPNLREIYLGYNQISGEVPITLSNASLLETIVLLRNNFTGPMPKDIGRLSHLKTFTIAENPIQDDINFISLLTNCTDLRLLEIGDNLLSGSLPNSIVNLSSRLDSFLIQSAGIYGKIPVGIGNLVGLTRFSLYGNYLDGTIPSSIGQLYNLRDLHLGENMFMNKIPSSLGNLTMLLHLYMQANTFSGNIPKTLVNCTNLLELDLSHNNLSGHIPQGIIKRASSISFYLSHNSFTGKIPYEIGSSLNLVNLDLSYNILLGPIPDSLRSCVGLESLRLGGNSLQGEIPRGFSALASLRELDLSSNNLSGPIPSFLAQLDYLENLNLSFNRFQGEVPTLGVFRNKTAISLVGNQELCGGILELNLPPCPPIPSPNSSKRIYLSTLLKILIPTVIVVVGSIPCCALFIRLKKEKLSSMLSLSTVEFLRLSYANLQKATDGFSESNLIGSGKFGSVYRGVLDDGQTLVAVKVLNLFVRGASKSFTAECNALKGIRHRNLLKILSVCESIDFQGNAFQALVYEFKSNGSLEQWLHCELIEEDAGEEGIRSSSRNLSLIQRLNIAIDVAQALDYLHFGTDSSIVHGDLKPSNILLDDDMTACIGDFGLAKIISSTQSLQESSSSIWMKGTIGYVPPEYATNHLVSTQGDVYSFGILLLEMFTSKRPTDEAFRDHLNLHNFVSHAVQNDVVLEIVDSSIQIQHDINNKMRDCITSILSIAVACSKTIPKDRMSMSDVANELRKISGIYLAQN